MGQLFNPTIASLTARAMFGRRRFLVLLILPALMVGLAVLGDALGARPQEWGPAVIQVLGLAVVLPVLALVIGAGVLGSEIDDGTVAHILAKPLPRHEIILTKLVVAIGITALTVAVPMYFVGLIADSNRLALGVAVGTAVGAVAYCALFLALSLVTRRPVLLGLLYVMIWEGLLTNLLPATRVLSVQQYALTVTDRIADTDLLYPTVGLAAALSMTGVILVGFTLLSVLRLQSFSVVGETS